MKPHSIARIISIVFFGVLFGCFLHFDHVKGSRMTRQEFLVKQGERFDRHFAKPVPMVAELLAGVVVTGVAFGAYELVAFGLSRALNGGADEHNS